MLMTVTRHKAFTKGNVYNGYYYHGRDLSDVGTRSLCAKNDLGKRHHINTGTDEFFNKHFRIIDGKR